MKTNDRPLTAVYRIAERNIEIISLHKRVHELCAAYRTEGAPDRIVRMTQELIDQERLFSKREDLLEGRMPRMWDDGYLETLAVYRKIAEDMLAFNTMLIHGSAVAVDGQAFLFAARSGVGKSTHARLWQQLLGERMTYVNDDKPLIRVSADAVTIFGTPYDGKHHRSNNVAVPLKAICFLRRGEQNVIRPLSIQEAFPLLMQQVFCPVDKAGMEKTLRLIKALLERVALYQLSCTKDLEAAQVAYDAMGKEQRDDA